MIKELATALAVGLVFASVRPPCNAEQVFKVGINGVFYCTKSRWLASLVWWDGRRLGEFPVKETPRRGGLVCHKDGTVEAGYFSVEKGVLKFNGRKIKPEDVKWAISGGGLFLLDGKVISSKEVRRLEGLSSYIVSHRSYSFILVHKDRKRVVLGVSVGGVPPAVLARRYAGKYYALLRLDGGGATTYFRNKKKPPYVNNAIGVPAEEKGK